MFIEYYGSVSTDFFNSYFTLDVYFENKFCVDISSFSFKGKKTKKNNNDKKAEKKKYNKKNNNDIP